MDAGTSHTVVLTEPALLHDASASRLYRYQPVCQDELRLVRILPGEPLRFQLLKHKMAAVPPYCALSYTWGTTTAHRAIDIGGRRLEVTENLANALAYLGTRLRGRNLLLWADAISINQNDRAERSRQVSLMGDIYQKANVVNVWLGTLHDVDRERIAFTKIAEVAKSAKQSCLGLRGYYDRTAKLMSVICSQPGLSA